MLSSFRINNGNGALSIASKPAGLLCQTSAAAKSREPSREKERERDRERGLIHREESDKRKKELVKRPCFFWMRKWFSELCRATVGGDALR